MIPYGRQTIDEADIQAVVAAMQSDYLTQGPRVAEFESRLAEYCQARFAVVFNSGTSALHGAYFAAGLSADAEFITTPLTFAATVNAGCFLGANPIFVDILPETGNLDPGAIEKALTPATRAIVPVHYAGHPVDLEPIAEIARRHRLFLIEDACHALGATYKGQRIGSCHLSDMAVFSFHPVKPITSGEGGAVTTNNEDYYRKLLMFRSHGIAKEGFINESDGDWYQEMHFLGYNYRLPDLLAALGISQLAKADDFLTRRREIAAYYDRVFADNLNFSTPVERPDCQSAYHLYPIRLSPKLLSRKRELFAAMRQAGLWVQVHYIPVYWHPYYQARGYARGRCPRAEEFYQREISIPLYAGMSPDEIDTVVQVISEIFDS